MGAPTATQVRLTLPPGITSWLVGGMEKRGGTRRTVGVQRSRVRGDKGEGWGVGTTGLIQCLTGLAFTVHRRPVWTGQWAWWSFTVCVYFMLLKCWVILKPISGQEFPSNQLRMRWSTCCIKIINTLLKLLNKKLEIMKTMAEIKLLN